MLRTKLEEAGKRVQEELIGSTSQAANIGLFFILFCFMLLFFYLFGFFYGDQHHMCNQQAGLVAGP